MCLEKKNGGLGFRDLEKFNQALLAKQGWRLLMNSDSLCARFLRSRYYPNGDFLSASLGSRPSYAWRSILFGRILLEKGLRRDVGSGEDINVWMDKWLFDEVPKAPLRKPVLFNLDLRVCDLICPQTKTWDMEKLQENFFAADIKLILKQKPAMGEKDAYEWVHNRWGAYTVKSGYWLACSLDQSEVRKEALARPSLNELRSKVWKVNTSPKIRIFLWKALSNALSVTDELIARGMKVDSRCQRCGFSSESINHILFSCPFARLLWAQIGFPFPPRGFENRSLLENFAYLLEIKSNKELPDALTLIFPWVLWMLWKNKNAFEFEGKEYAVEATVEKIKDDARQWFEVHLPTVNNEETCRRRNSKVQWKAPSAGILKCNVGVAWTKSTKLAGAAWFVRDSREVVQLHSRRAFSGIDSLVEAKHLALVWAIESMAFHKINKVFFEVEAPDLVGAITRPRAWPAFRGYGAEILEVLQRLGEWELQSISREENKCAFLMARSVTKEQRLQSYVAQGEPEWLRRVLDEDRTRR
ncbi:unnamed protein product [Brassica oleracea]